MVVSSMASRLFFLSFNSLLQIPILSKEKKSSIILLEMSFSLLFLLVWVRAVKVSKILDNLTWNGEYNWVEALEPHNIDSSRDWCKLYPEESFLDAWILKIL